MGKTTYKDAGVDLERYRDAMARIGPLVRRTQTPRVMPLPGGFAGLFSLDFESPLFRRHYQDPVLVSCADGVGTKLKVAGLAGQHCTIGVDLVAMNVNDLICCGAEPLFFLDYVAMASDDPPLLADIVSGISDGCLAAECALLGGETAIMPDVYRPGDYDLAGFAVGVVERARVMDGSAVGEGDVLVGVASSGLHSNGFSLARKIVFDIADLAIDAPIDELDQTVGEALLTPTRIYVRALRNIAQHYTVKHVMHAVAHITGGGLHENLQRVLPEGCQAVVRRESWPVPKIFRWLAEVGDVEPDEMNRVFNMGLGLVLVVSGYYADSIRAQLEDAGLESWTIGQIVAGPRGVVWHDQQGVA